MLEPVAVANGDLDNDNTVEQQVVIEQRLLKINNQLFIYRIPPMQSIDGHRAEQWNLSKPLLPNACSLEVYRKDEELIINILAERPKTGEGSVEGAKENYLFARSTVHLNITIPPTNSSSQHHPTNNVLEHWISPTIDSSRYFALRITNPSTKQEALIGIGFIERNDATNFRMACDDYVNSLMKEKKALELHRQFEESLAIDEVEEPKKQQQQHAHKSSLGLKEGEKLHINITTNAKKILENNDRTIKKVRGTVKGGTTGLKKPPPPPTDDASSLPTTTCAASPLDDSCAFKNDETEDGGVDWGDFEG
jgi:hypothetical protein